MLMGWVKGLYLFADYRLAKSSTSHICNRAQKWAFNPMWSCDRLPQNLKV